MNMKNIAVILAGGSGKRFGADRPKQLLALDDGRSVLEHAVASFRTCDCINGIIVVMHADWIESPELQPLKDTGVAFVAGGRERWESSWNAIQYLAHMEEREACNLLIHDAARPYVSERIIRDVCQALEENEAVTVAVPATDTIYRVEEGLLKEIPDRTTMMRAQTPQAFRFSLIRRAYERALQDPNLQATDDCGIVHHYLPEQPVCIIHGDESNRKITYKEDL